MQLKRGRGKSNTTLYVGHSLRQATSWLYDTIQHDMVDLRVLKKLT